MTFTYDVTTDSGKVRLLANDNDGTTHLFEDDEIDAFLGLESSSVLRAAAMAIETIAGNEVLVQKKITLLDLKTDGPALSQELRQLAKSLRERSEAVDGVDEDLFDYAEMALPVFGYNARLLNEFQRAGLV